jgi:phosphinothricin acetyltransferase
MMLNLKLRAIRQDDGKAIIDIFNYYIKNSMAAYLEQEVPYAAFEMLIGQTNGLPSVSVVNGEDKVVGFGFLKPYHKFSTFSGTAEVSYFIAPEYTGKGIGGRILDNLISSAKQIGIECILANISSENEVSIKFHEKHGFSRCGQFKKIGKKSGKYFDVIWMQKGI